MEDEEYNVEYWQEKDVKDGEERFTCDYEDCKQSYKQKCHFTEELTCKKCGKTFGIKNDLKNDLLSHESKRQL